MSLGNLLDTKKQTHCAQNANIPKYPNTISRTVTWGGLIFPPPLGLLVIENGESTKYVRKNWRLRFAVLGFSTPDGYC